MISTGFRFNPTDEELIEILIEKVSGNITMSFDFIVERNIYELEPQNLLWIQSVALNNNERYYYCKREGDSREVSGRGWWKATSHVKTISANGRVVGYKRPLTFHRFRDNERKRKGAIKTDWIMHEYALHSIPTDWRLCKIKYKGKERLEEDLENIRNSSGPMSLEAAGGCSSSINPMQLDQFAFKEQQLQPQPLLLPLTLINNDYENYFGSNSNSNTRFEISVGVQQQGMELISLFDPSWMPLMATPSHMASQQHKQSAEPREAQSPFPDLWSSWENWHRPPLSSKY
ncbi:PREDICTED: putative NAC domain-containing protein 94 [Theobroma cacao]|uniref:NAC domain-containing protein 94 n=1 Tax=Theobroma cacao TaxID=3641 RepID=A0AB32V923_THECC|nr:PREDICTED: putative NAC domain-containing protein 94 [Theobroma cacao]